jgi:hypothetical protein
MGSPTLDAIRDMPHAVTPDRVGGWRGRLLRAWQALFVDGQVTVDEYEREVTKAARATEPEALAEVAKREAVDAKQRQDAFYERERRERNAKAERALRSALRSILEIDAPDAPVVERHGTVALEIGGVLYSLRESSDWNGKRTQAISVDKPCVYQERGCFNYVNGHNNIGAAVPQGYTPLAQLGAGLERLERTPHCDTDMCRWRASGKTDDEIQALLEEQRKSQPWNAPVDFTQVLTSGGYWTQGMGYSGQYGVWYGRRRTGT